MTDPALPASVRPDMLCIGSVLWDVIGRSGLRMKAGDDVPGRITTLPGGVAMNIAMTLARFGTRPALLSVVGTDPDGEQLLREACRLGLRTEFVHRSDRPTDRYMAIEGANGLIAAIADAHGLEDAGAAILAPLSDGRLGTVADPWSGCIALDGNLTEALLASIATRPEFALADLRVAPASPGKARRLLPLLRHPRATFYVNLIEANLILDASHETTERAAEALLARGAHRVLVTDGANPASLADAQAIQTRPPPPVAVQRVTGAGDTFMAAHIAAELRGAGTGEALDAALAAAAAYISSVEVP